MQIERKIERLAEMGDIERLARILRQDGDPHPRVLAARALADIDDRQVPELLIGAALNDPDGSVQAAARQALRQMLGFQAELVLTFAAATSAPDPGWLILAPPASTEDEPGEENEWGLTNAEGETLHGLIAIAQSDPNRQTRLRAIRVLGRVRDMSATRVLAELALWDDDDVVSEAAYQAIEATFGDDADKILEEVRRDVMGEPEEPAKAPERSPYNNMAPARSTSSWDLPHNSSVIKEEGAPIWLLLVVVAAIAGGVWWFFIR